MRVVRPPFRVLSETVGAAYSVTFSGPNEARVFWEQLQISPRPSPYDRVPPEPIHPSTLDGDTVHVPRALGRQLFKSGTYTLPPFRAHEFTVALPPRPHQEEAIRTVTDMFNNQGVSETILQAGCGDGKTYTFLAIAAQLGGRTMVLVHTSKLVDQWVEAVHKTLPGTSVGVLKASKKPKDTDAIVIASIQTLVNRDETFEGFRLVGIDEAHHVPAATFASVVGRIPCQRLALSATPKGRSDGLEDLLFWLCGSMVRMQGPRVVARVEKHMFQTRVRQPGTPIQTRTRRRLSQEVARNQHILDVVRSKFAEGHCVLVLTEFVDHAEALSEQVLNSGVFCGKVQRNVDAPVLFASYAFCKEGVDLQRISCLVLALPCPGNVEQVLGRIRQAEPGSTRLDPVVIDIRDFPLYGHFKYKRLDDFYNLRNWNAQNIQL